MLRQFFEGIRIYNKKPLFIYDHIKRLFVSSKIMGLNMNYSQKKVYDTMKKLIKINNLVDGYIRPIIYRSSHSMSPETYDCKTLVAIACWKWGTLFNNDGISMNISQYPNSKIIYILLKQNLQDLIKHPLSQELIQKKKKKKF